MNFIDIRSFDEYLYSSYCFAPAWIDSNPH